MIYDQTQIIQRIERGETANEIWPDIDPSMFGLDATHFLYGSACTFRAAGMVGKAVEMGTIIQNFLRNESCHTSKTETAISAVQQSEAGITLSSSLAKWNKEWKR